MLSRTDFHEDGNGSSAYGHREFNGEPDYYYTGDVKDRANGCSYHSEDKPTIKVLPGYDYDLNLTFKIDIVDTDIGDAQAVQTYQFKIQLCSSHPCADGS